jgi:hypothetical protein
MSVRGMQAQLNRFKARLPAPDLCPGTCVPLRILEADDPARALPEQCEVCGRRPQPGSIRVLVVVRPTG